MKIRIRGNTVRYRLSKSEVTTLAQTGRIEEQTRFGTQTLVYAIVQTDAPELSADLIDYTITLHVPKEQLQSWAATDQVGLEHRMPLEAEGSLYLLLEKDFKCIDADVSEDQSDFFENPHLTC
jgi:hypothetical protein